MSPTVVVTRRAHFNAAHRLYNPTWSDAENARVFGPCANPNFHGHNYNLDVSVAGEVAPATGYVIDIKVLKDLIEEHVLRRLDHRNLNLDVPEFADGKLIPTGEHLARFICERVQAALAHTTARVVRVHLAEDATLSSAYEVDA